MTRPQLPHRKITSTHVPASSEPGRSRRRVFDRPPPASGGPERRAPGSDLRNSGRPVGGSPVLSSCARAGRRPAETQDSRRQPILRLHDRRDFAKHDRDRNASIRSSHVADVDLSAFGVPPRGELVVVCARAKRVGGRHDTRPPSRALTRSRSLRSSVLGARSSRPTCSRATRSGPLGSWNGGSNPPAPIHFSHVPNPVWIAPTRRSMCETLR